MTDTAEPTMLSDDRTASARSFFDVEPPARTLPPPTGMVAMVPQLPRVAPPAPTPLPTTAPSPFAFSAASTTPPPSGPRKQNQGGGGRKFASRLLLLAALGGITFAGVKYGPALMDRAQGDTTDSEPAAPLVFPVVAPPAVPARTATFVVEQPAEDGSTIRYEVTNDFETGVSRMLIDRTASPDVEVLAVFDVANLHLVDDPTWWAMPRGEFPFPVPSEREQWIRTVDDYFPVPMRSYVTIDQSTESVLGDESMRHLVVTIDADAMVKDVAAGVIDPTTGLQIPATPPGPGAFVPPVSVAGTELIEPVTVEMWVDSSGMIRKLVEPPILGGRTITLVSLSDQAFEPAFPAPETTAPLTAGQLTQFAL